MPRPCSVCTHQDRAAIDAALVAGEPNRRVAARYAVSEQAIRRHRAEHLPTALVQAQAAEDAALADDLLGQVMALKSRALAILDKAEHARDFRACASLLREARGSVELLARMAAHVQQAAVGAAGVHGDPGYDLGRLTLGELEVFDALMAKASGEETEQGRRDRLAEVISILDEAGVFAIPGMIGPGRRPGHDDNTL